MNLQTDELMQPQKDTDVYAIHGAEPEVLAYAMAKYSRSALTMKESLAEIIGCVRGRCSRPSRGG